jgi:hypothetical protein
MKLRKLKLKDFIKKNLIKISCQMTYLDQKIIEMLKEHSKIKEKDQKTSSSLRHNNP